MKRLKVKKVSTLPVKADAVIELMDKEGVPFQPIDTVNWDIFPYRPEVFFRIAHTNDAILLHYTVKEEGTCACYTMDDDPVYRDSCVEFFISLANDNVYYNLECNCIGTLLFRGKENGERELAPAGIPCLIDRWASLGTDPFEERYGEVMWEVALVLPYTAFFKHQISSLDGKTVRANFYKCGDNLPVPHFLSWNPIEAEKPNFHLPQFFGTLLFE